MSRTLRAIMILLLVASCGSRSGTSTSGKLLDDACSILRANPEYKRAFRATERKWGIPMHVQMATIHQESKFKSDARTPFKYTLGVIPMGRQSSAYGYSQALDGTWDEYVKDQNKRRARRNNIRDATDFIGWYMDASQDRLGISKADARNQYLAYHEGRSGFARGSYRGKPWLVNVAGKVESRSQMYKSQLRRCR